MDPKFHPAIVAIKTDNLERLQTLVRADPTLATSRSSTSHPTLLQCLVLSGNDLGNKLEMARVLIQAGAELNGPLVACGSCDNVEVAGLLLDSGAAIDGTGGWSPLEEALYWHNRRAIDLLVRRGASVRNLRIAAGLGRLDLIDGFFNSDGSLKPEAGTIKWPFGDSSWTNDRQGILNNAFVYACINGHLDAAKLLMDKGAEINAIPGGFDYAGTGLHFAAYNGHKSVVEFLIQCGADRTIKDLKVGGTPAGWAEVAGHLEICDYLNSSKSKEE